RGDAGLVARGRPPRIDLGVGLAAGAHGARVGAARPGLIGRGAAPVPVGALGAAGALVGVARRLGVVPVGLVVPAVVEFVVVLEPQVHHGSAPQRSPLRPPPRERAYRRASGAVGTGRSPNRARPTRTMGAPSSTA